MSIYSDREISKRLGTHIRVEPYTPGALQPASLDVHLGREFKLMPAGMGEWSRGQVDELSLVVDPTEDSELFFIDVDVVKGDHLTVEPGDFVLGTTHERVGLSAEVAARFEGKSSLGRLGLMTHVTAGFIDPGFNGHITLEIKNVLPIPIRLYPGMRIGQLCFMPVEGDVQSPYGSAAVGSHYSGQSGPTASRSHINFKQIDVY